MTALLDAVGIDAGYDGARCVREVDLSVQPGEVVALLGPNGAGKTTTLSVFSGLVRPMNGTLSLFGSACDRWGRSAVGARARAGLAHVPEDRCLFADLTADEHLALAVPRREVAAARRRAREWFGALDAVAGRPAGLLSGGEQQMLAIARALVRRPRLLLVDELSLGLAPQVVTELFGVLRRIADDEGTGILVVEQQVPVALAHADRAVVLVHGRVVLRGDAAELRSDRELLASAYLGGAGGG